LKVNYLFFFFFATFFFAFFFAIIEPPPFLNASAHCAGAEYKFFFVSRSREKFFLEFFYTTSMYVKNSRPVYSIEHIARLWNRFVKKLYTGSVREHTFAANNFFRTYPRVRLRCSRNYLRLIFTRFPVPLQGSGF